MSSAKNIVVVNSSPLIYLSAIKKINILKKLFHEIIIPEAVKKEIIFGGKNNFAFKEVVGQTWIITKRIKNRLAKDYLLTDIDAGEAEVIVLSEELKAKTVIMDDRLGRRLAKLRGLNVIGTLRVLVAAREKGIITEIKPLIRQMKAAGFWISDDVQEAILKHSNELDN